MGIFSKSPDPTESEDRYWIKKGMEVRHKDLSVPLTVERVVYKDVAQRDGTTKKYTVGVKCHWLTPDGAYHTGTFHTKELTKG